jgi:hypothetical protein
MASGLKVQTLTIYTVIVTFANLHIVTLIKFFDILEKSKKLLDESLFIDHINFLHHQVIGGLKLVVG